MSSQMTTTAMFHQQHHPLSDSSSSYCDSPHMRQTSRLSDRSSSYCDSPVRRQHSGSGSVESPHSRQHSGVSGHSYSDLSYTWTGSSRHSRQSSQVSSVSGHNTTGHSGHSRQFSNDSYGPPQHQRYSSRDSGHSYDNRAFETSPSLARHRRRQYHHSRQSSSEQQHSSHSRQSSYEIQPPPVNIDLSRPYIGHVTSPTPPAFKLPPNYPKYSPVSQDQGYHTMVGPQSSPDTSPGASMDMSSLQLICPTGV